MKETVRPAGLVLAVTDFAVPSYVCVRPPRATEAVALAMTSVPVALPVKFESVMMPTTV